MPKCDFNEVAIQLYGNRTSAWMFIIYKVFLGESHAYSC